VRGCRGLQVEVPVGAAQIQIDIDRDASRARSHVADVRGSGGNRGRRCRGHRSPGRVRRFGVVVRFREELRVDPAALRANLLTAPAVSVSHWGKWRRVHGARTEVINREDRRAAEWWCRPTSVDRDIGSFVARGGKKIAAAVSCVALSAQMGRPVRESATRHAAPGGGHSPVAAIIFLLLFVTFQRLRQAALVIVNVPLATVGGIAALWLGGHQLEPVRPRWVYCAVRRGGAQRRGPHHRGQPIACRRDGIAGRDPSPGRAAGSSRC